MLKERIAKELDFIGEHWVKGNNRPPFNYGGWRDECMKNLEDLFKQWALEMIGEDEPTEVWINHVGEKVIRNELRLELRQKIRE